MTANQSKIGFVLLILFGTLMAAELETLEPATTVKVVALTKEPIYSLEYDKVATLNKTSLSLTKSEYYLDEQKLIEREVLNPISFSQGTPTMCNDNPFTCDYVVKFTPSVGLQLTAKDLIGGVIGDAQVSKIFYVREETSLTLVKATANTSEYLASTTTYIEETNLSSLKMETGKSYEFVIRFTKSQYASADIYDTFAGIENKELAIWNATGGTKYTVIINGTNYTVHEFTTNSTFNISGTIPTLDVLVVGGGGGASYGGGGAGGMNFTTLTNVSGNYTVYVGLGGAGGVVGTSSGTAGQWSAFGALVNASGGGYGGGADIAGGNGASGGGGGASTGTLRAGGTGIAGQGFAGGNNLVSGVPIAGGGGGGASQNGTTPTAGAVGGFGGNGTNNTINGTSRAFAGGGGAGVGGPGSYTGGTGGTGGGGNACAVNACAGGNGTNGTGGGGGGAGNTGTGGRGGNGIVIVRYETEEPLTPGVYLCTGTVTTSTMNFTTYDVFTGNAINASYVLSTNINYSGLNTTLNYTTTNTTLNFCISPATLNTTAIFTATISASGYLSKYYSVTFNASNVSQALGTTLVNITSGGLFTFIVQNVYGADLVGSALTVEILNVSTGNYTPVTSGTTDITGGATFPLAQFETYRINVSYPGYNNGSFIFIASTTTTINIQLTQNTTVTIPDFNVWGTTNYTITPAAGFYNTSKNLTFVVASNTSTLESFGMYVVKSNNTTTVVYNQSNTTAAGGSLTFLATPSATYVVYAWFKEANNSNFTIPPVTYYITNQSVGLAQIRDMLATGNVVTGWTFYFIALCIAVGAGIAVNQMVGVGSSAAAIAALAVLAFFSILAPSGLYLFWVVTPFMATMVVGAVTIAVIYVTNYGA